MCVCVRALSRTVVRFPSISDALFFHFHFKYPYCPTIVALRSSKHLHRFLRDQEAFNKIAAFPQWNDPSFIFFFSCSCSFGLAITYAIVWCTSVNSALTTTVIGCLKNLVIAYAGMFVGGDYVFSWLNFTGITVSVTGAIVYSFVQFRAKQSDSSTTSGRGTDPSSTEAGNAKEAELASLLVDHHGSDDDAGDRGFEDDEEGNMSDEEAAFLADDNSSF